MTATVSPPRRRRVGWTPGRHAALALVAALVAFYLVFPLLVTIPISFNSVRRVGFPPKGFSLQWYEEFLGIGDPSGSRWLSATWLSVRIAVATSVLSTVLGGLAAIPVARASFWGKNLIQTLLLLPLVLPVIVLAVGIFLFYVPLGLLGSPAGIVFGHSVLAIPYVTLIVAATLKNFDVRLEWAAMSLGASRARTLWSVTIPLVRPGILAGALFAFLTSFDELLIALFVSGTRAVTLPRLLWDFLRTEASPVIAVVSTLLTLFSVLAVALIALVQRERR
ncbi:ABC transporter permease [Desertimonas flava]|uniref:ABC transporter permease n=1 Tax=Desertimonas flava TaxID=2064846 RepID=UPI000E347F49|nr:ABC transporter permease [Desertimonas flava]